MQTIRATVRMKPGSGGTPRVAQRCISGPALTFNFVLSAARNMWRAFSTERSHGRALASADRSYGPRNTRLITKVTRPRTGRVAACSSAVTSGFGTQKLPSGRVLVRRSRTCWSTAWSWKRSSGVLFSRLRTFTTSTAFATTTARRTSNSGSKSNHRDSVLLNRSIARLAPALPSAAVFTLA